MNKKFPPGGEPAKEKPEGGKENALSRLSGKLGEASHEGDGTQILAFPAALKW